MLFSHKVRCMLFLVAVWVASVRASVAWAVFYNGANLTHDAPMSHTSLMQTHIDIQVSQVPFLRSYKFCMPGKDQGIPIMTQQPSVLYQTYITEETDLVEDAKHARSTWADLHPEGLQMSYTDDKNMLEFMEANFDARVVKAFNSMPLGVMKADFWRYAVIYINGGLYADVDVVPKMNMSSWFKKQKGRRPMTWEEAGCSMLLGFENDAHVSNWAFAAVKQHPVLNRTIELIVDRAEGGIDTSMHDFVHYHTGPGVITSGLHQYSSETSDSCTGNPKYTDMIKMHGSNICIMSEDRWKNTVQNLYGSQNWHGNYSRWIDQALYERESNPCTCYIE